MVKRNKILPRLLLGLCSLQMVLPLILAISVFFIAREQKRIVSENIGNTAFFQQIRLSEQEAGHDIVSGQEIEYNGTMYDVRSVQKENGQYVILALADRDETKVQQLNGHQLNGIDKKSTDQIQVLPFLFLFYEQPNSWSICVTAPVIHFVTIAAPLYAAQQKALFRPPCPMVC